MAKNNFEEFNFQHYIDAVKQKRMDWNIFTDLMREISYSDMGRLRLLNAILLNELTRDYSDMDKSKYLNVILLTEFKNEIQKEQNFQMTQNEDFENSIESNVHEILNEDTNNKNQDDLSSSCKKEIIECDTSEFDDNILNEMTQNENLENSEDSNYHKIENEYLENSEESNIHENTNEDANNKNQENMALEIIECNTIESETKVFLCKICNKGYKMYFHLKQHIRNIHEKEESNTSNLTDVRIDKKIDENDLTMNQNDDSIANVNIRHKCESCGKSFSQAGYLKKHINSVHEGHKDYKCETCGKSITTLRNLKKHIHSVHEGHRDYKCESCDRSFFQAGDLKKHIRTVHKGHKDHTKNSGKDDIAPENIDEKGSTREDTPTFSTIKLREANNQCKKCNQEFTFATNVRRHEKYCLSNEQTNYPNRQYIRTYEYECNICRKRMRYISQAKEHEKHHKSCTECGITRSKKCKLGTNKCPHAHCKYTTSRKFNLNRHLQNKM